jgi:hypothetical protein
LNQVTLAESDVTDSISVLLRTRSVRLHLALYPNHDFAKRAFLHPPVGVVRVGELMNRINDGMDVKPRELTQHVF